MLFFRGGSSPVDQNSGPVKSGRLVIVGLKSKRFAEHSNPQKRLPVERVMKLREEDPKRSSYSTIQSNPIISGNPRTLHFPDFCGANWICSGDGLTIGSSKCRTDAGSEVEAKGKGCLAYIIEKCSLLHHPRY